MDANKILQLKLFIQQCESNPAVLQDPSLRFFRDYLERLGAKLPTSAYGKGESAKKPDVKGYTGDESDDDMPELEEQCGTSNSTPKAAEENASDEEIVESEVELDNEGVVEPDNDPPQKMGDPSVEITEEKRDAAQMAKAKAMEAISEGDLDEAISHLTEAVMCNPTSAIIYASRAAVFVKMRKPNAAIWDANAAIKINPDSAKGYKSRGMARAMLGLWEEAAKDLHLASRLDYDEEIATVLKRVEPNVHKIEEHRRKYERLRREREERKIERERQRRRAESQAAYERAKKQEQFSTGRKPGGMPGGFPGGMPGGFPGGMPGNVDMSKILNDPEMMAAFKDPEVMAALQDGDSESMESVALTANFTFVARDSKTGKSAPINRLAPQTEKEKALFAEGEARDARRKRDRQRKKEDFDGKLHSGSDRLQVLLTEGRVLCDMPALADRDSILIKDTRLENALICQPQQRNLHGRIFGGFLMRRAFELAFSTCYAFVGHKPSFLEVDHVDFLKPVDVGNFLRFKSGVLYTQLDDPNRPLINVEVVAHVTQPELRSSEVSNNFYFKFTAHSDALESGLKIRRVLPATEEEARRILERYFTENLN